MSTVQATYPDSVARIWLVWWTCSNLQQGIVPWLMAPCAPEPIFIFNLFRVLSRPCLVLLLWCNSEQAANHQRTDLPTGENPVMKMNFHVLQNIYIKCFVFPHHLVHAWRQTQHYLFCNYYSVGNQQWSIKPVVVSEHGWVNDINELHWAKQFPMNV